MADDWVELRVHGVSGTPPEELLAKPHVLQVDGDDKSRFFRAVNSDDRELLATDGHTIEGFHWGRYTSGTWLKALWLALIPFGLINAATFMLPAAERRDGSVDRAARRWRIAALAGLRLQALFLTTTFAFATGLLLIDVVGTRWAYRHLDVIPDAFERWVPATAVLAAGLVFAFFGRRLRPGPLLAGPDRELPPDPALQPVDATRPRGPIGPQPDGRRTPFALPAFYRGDTDTPALLALHVSAGLLTVALMAQQFSHEKLWSRGPSLATVVFILIGLTIAATVSLGDPERAATTLNDTAHTDATNRWHRTVSRAALALVIVAIGALLLAAVNVLTHGLPVQGKRASLEGKDRFIQTELVDRVAEFDHVGILLVAFGLVAAIGAVVPALGLARRTRRWQATPDEPAWAFRPYSGGRASVAFANLAVLLGVGFSAAMVTGVSTALGIREVNPKGAGTIEGSTPLIDRVAYAWGLGIVVALVSIAVWLAASRFRSRPALAPHVDVGYPDHDPYPAERLSASPFPLPRLERWRAKLGSAVWASRLKNHAAGLVWFIVGLGGVLAVFLGWAELAGMKKYGPPRPPELLRPLSVSPEDVSGLHGFWLQVGPALIQLGSLALLGLIVLLVTKGRQAVKDEHTRRGINIIWDVIAFWPHAVHPFTPEPYSQRTVVDLSERIRSHVWAGPDEAEHRDVIVCGHSQGSLISFAALNLLSDAELDHIGLLTFGSQLRVIFPRAFPAYVNAEAIEDLRQRLGSAWVNLWRDTDPLAGPVLSWNHTWTDGTWTSEQFDVPDHARPPQRSANPALVGVDRIVKAFDVWQCGDDWRLTDPVRRLETLPADTEALQAAPINRLRGHSWFWSDPVWPAALAELRNR